MKGLGCVLIDDDIDDRQIFEIALSDLRKRVDYHLLEKIQEVQTLAIEAIENINFVFLDLHLAGCSGRSCVDQLKQIRDLKNAKIILYSTISSENYIQSTQDWGAHHYLVKTSGIDDLTNALEAIFATENLPYDLSFKSFSPINYQYGEFIKL